MSDIDETFEKYQKWKKAREPSPEEKAAEEEEDRKYTRRLICSVAAIFGMYAIGFLAAVVVACLIVKWIFF